MNDSISKEEIIDDLREGCQRTETFEPEFAFDRMNGSRWMPDLND